MNSIVSNVAARIPADVVGIIASASNYVPASVELRAIITLVLVLLVAALGVGIIARIFLGRQSNLNHTVSSAMGILAIYVITVVIYTFRPWSLEQLLSPLPFTAFWGDHLVIMPLRGTSFTTLSSHMLSLVILAFLVNVMDTVLPQGENIITWYLLRGITVVMAMLLHLLANWALNAYLPQVLVLYAPTILLMILITTLLIGIARIILGVVLTIASPIVGGIYTFFFASKVGIQLTKSVFSTAIICGVFYLMEYFGYTVISISQSALIAYGPLLVTLLILWYLLGHEL